MLLLLYDFPYTKSPRQNIHIYAVSIQAIVKTQMSTSVAKS